MPKIPQHDAHHIVFGAGLIGCYLGACLLQSQQRVSFYTRESRFKTLSAHPLQVTDYLKHHYRAENPIDLLDNHRLRSLKEAADVVWLTVKCTALKDVIDELHHCVDESSIIICCQNGIANHHLIKAAFPNNPVIRAMIPFNVVELSPAHFHRATQGLMSIEVTPAMETTVKWMARQLSSPMLPLDITYNMTALQWAKLQLNLSNALNALVDMPVTAMLKKRKYRLIIAMMMDELLRICHKKKIKLPKITNLPNKWIPYVLRCPNFVFEILAKSMLAIDSEAKLSMWWDLHQGKPTEIDFINGKVVDEASELDISAPANRLITALIKKREQGKLDTMQELEKRFDALLENKK